jgi:hypothetical protein
MKGELRVRARAQAPRLEGEFAKNANNAKDAKDAKNANDL